MSSDFLSPVFGKQIFLVSASRILPGTKVGFYSRGSSIFFFLCNIPVAALVAYRAAFFRHWLHICKFLPQPTILQEKRVFLVTSVVSEMQRSFGVADYCLFGVTLLFSAGIGLFFALRGKKKKANDMFTGVLKFFFAFLRVDICKNVG